MYLRKDAKLGLAIGCVLLAVIVVYVAVTSGPDQNTPQVTLTDEFGNPVNPTVDVAVDPAPPVVDQPVVEVTPPSDRTDPFALPATNPTPMAARTDHQAREDNWLLALNEGRVPPMMTQTPPLQPAPAPPVQPVDISPLQPVPALGTTSPIAVQPTTPAGAGGTVHIVQRGETLSKIAADAYGDARYYPHILRANPGLVPEKLRPGMRINLPDASEVRGGGSSAVSNQATTATVDSRTEYRVQPGDSLHRISQKLYGTADLAERIYQLNQSTIGPDRARLKVGQVLKLPQPPTAGE
jgi:nucleoid-associated protein YgaU